MALTAAWKEADYQDGLIGTYKVAANTKIYQGAMVFVRNTDGYAYNARAGQSSTDIFVGVAVETVDNTGGAAGAKTIRVWKAGEFTFAGSSLAQTNVGAAVYAVDENTITTTASTNVLVGYITEVISATRARVRITNAVR